MKHAALSVAATLLLPLGAHADPPRPAGPPGPPPAAPASAAAPATAAAPPTPSAGPAFGEERDPREQRRYDHRRADAVRARQVSRQLLALGREAHDPVLILAAARLLSQSPAPRPLSQIGAAALPAPEPGAPPEPPPPRIPPRTAGPPPEIEHDVTPRDLYAEARALLGGKAGPLPQATLALLGKLEGAEVIARGGSHGPQRICDALSPGVKITYDIWYDAKEQAVVAIAGDGPGALHVHVEDEQGLPVSTTLDRVLLSWYPRRRSIYRISIVNRGTDRVGYCLETN